MRVLVLGAGFGGLELTTRLSEELGEDADVTLIDKGEGFIFGFSKLDVMFGRTPPESVLHAYRDVVKPGVRFVQATIRSIDPRQRRVDTDAGAFEGDVLVVALGADLDPAATPGLLEAGHEFYTVPGAFALRDVLDRFEGGRVIVGVTSTPFKCPPAPSETALLLHDFLDLRGLRQRSEISLVMPLPVPIPPSPDASKALLAAFAERDIHWHPQRLVQELDPATGVARFADGAEMPFDLFLGVPVHKVPPVVEQSGPVRRRLGPGQPPDARDVVPGVYAVGDVTSVGTPKAGVFAEGQATVVADAIVAAARGAAGATDYDGRGICYLEFGHDQVALVDVTFVTGQAPFGYLQGPSADLAEQKSDFGKTRIQRWFGRALVTRLTGRSPPRERPPVARRGVGGCGRAAGPRVRARTRGAAARVGQGAGPERRRAGRRRADPGQLVGTPAEPRHLRRGQRPRRLTRRGADAPREGKVTLVHRRLWPSLLRLADRFPAGATMVLHQEHTTTGADRTTEFRRAGMGPARRAPRGSASARTRRGTGCRTSSGRPDQLERRLSWCGAIQLRLAADVDAVRLVGEIGAVLAVAGQPAQQLEDRVAAVTDPFGLRRLRSLPRMLRLLRRSSSRSSPWSRRRPSTGPESRGLSRTISSRMPSGFSVVTTWLSNASCRTSSASPTPVAHSAARPAAGAASAASVLSKARRSPCPPYLCALESQRMLRSQGARYASRPSGW